MQLRCPEFEVGILTVWLLRTLPWRRMKARLMVRLSKGEFDSTSHRNYSADQRWRCEIIVECFMPNTTLSYPRLVVATPELAPLL